MTVIWHKNLHKYYFAPIHLLLQSFTVKDTPNETLFQMWNLPKPNFVLVPDKLWEVIVLSKIYFSTGGPSMPCFEQSWMQDLSTYILHALWPYYITTFDHKIMF